MHQPAAFDRVGWIASGALTFFLALIFVYGAFAFLGFDCLGSACSAIGIAQLGMALIGLVPAGAMLVRAWQGRGSPGYWFCATVVAYGAWGLVAGLWLSS